MAVESLNANSTSLNLTLHLVDIEDGSDTLRILSEKLFEYPKAIGIVGPYSSGTSQEISTLNTVLDKPYISGTSTSPALSDDEIYPMFGRTSASGQLNAIALSKIVIQAGWRRMAFINEDTVYGSGLIESVMNLANNNGIQVIDQVVHPASGSLTLDEMKDVIDTQLETLKVQHSYVIMYHGLLGQLVLLRALKKNMIGIQENGITYQWLLGDAMCYDLIATARGDCDAECLEALPQLREAMRGIVCGQAAYEFDNDWIDNVWDVENGEGKLTTEQIEKSRMTDWSGVNRYSYVPHYYDAVLVYHHAIEIICKDKTSNELDNCLSELPNQGSTIIETIKNVEFDGRTRKVSFLENIDRALPINLVSFHNNGTSNEYGFQEFGEFLPSELVQEGQAELSIDEPYYANLSNKPPADMFRANIPSSIRDITWCFYVLSAVLCVLVLIVMIKHQKVANGATFLSFKNIVLMVISILVTEAIVIFASLDTINPSSITIVSLVESLAYLCPMIILAIVLGRVYRLKKVVFNKSLSSIRFSKLFNVYCVAVVISLPFVIVMQGILRNWNHLDEEMILQDENEQNFFSLANIIFDKFNDSNVMIWSHCVLMMYCSLMAFILAFWAHKCAGSNIRRIKPLTAKELLDLSRCATFLTILFLIDSVLMYILAYSGDSSNNGDEINDRIAFDNGDSKITIERLKWIICSKIISIFLFGNSLIIASFRTRFNLQVLPMIKFLAPKSRTSPTSTYEKSTNLSTTTGGGATQSKYDLDDGLAGRLRVLTTNKDGSSIVLSNLLSTDNGSLTEGWTTGENSLHPTSKYSKISTTPTSGKTVTKNNDTLASKSGNGSVVSYNRPMSKSFNASQFGSELKKMSQTELKSFYSKLEVVLRSKREQWQRLFARLSTIDKDIRAKTSIWEVYMIRAKRLNCKKKIVPLGK
eukprot:TRINITY_DN4526_c0_g1_i1.p1 TRINITY_DN4526_c0_g1~~TRINITY_DN4526_c0_g1_i1.p1  ORF type:complete len:1015 (+),score=197.39 TRINITY_DN4526_c0_g1_i1:260-3046(+)